MPLKSIHHHGFTVSNLERSLPFYRDVLGLEVARISERKDLPSYDTILGYDDVHLHVVILTHPINDFVLELFQYENPPGTTRELGNHFVGASHLAFEVDDIDAESERIKAAGYTSINPPVDVDRGGIVVARAMYALDPDGISVELFQEYHDVVAQ
jgi:glyoxylase I family protein